MDKTNAPADPAQGSGQHDIVGAQCVGGGLNAGRALDGGDDRLDVGQRAGKARRQVIGQ